MIWFVIICMVILLTSIRYYLNARDMYRRIFNEPFERIIIKDTVKRPIIVQDETLFSTYHHSIIGETFRRTHLRESAHRLIDKCLDEGLIEITEDESNVPQTKKIRLKITLLN